MSEPEPTAEQLERCEWISEDGIRCELTKWAHIKYGINHLVPDPFLAAWRAEFVKQKSREL